MVDFLETMFFGGVYLNIVLALFNLIPIPPLDGSHVLASLLPPEVALQYRRVGFVGIIAILLLLRVPAISEGFHSLIMMVTAPPPY